MHLLAEPVAELAEDQLGARVDVDEGFGKREALADQPTERRGERLCPEVPPRGLSLRGLDRLVERRQGILAR